MSGFTKDKGPGADPRAPNPFLQLQHHPRPSPISSRNNEILQGTYSSPLAFPSNYSALGPSHPSAAITRSFDPQSIQRPSVAPSSLPSKPQGTYSPVQTAPLDYLKRSSHLQPTDDDITRNLHRRGTRPPGPLFDNDMQPVPHRTRSPPVFPGNYPPAKSVDPPVEFQRQRPPGPLFDDDMQPVPQRTRSPPVFPVNYLPAESLGQFSEPQRPALSSPMWGNQTRANNNSSIKRVGQEQLPQNSRRHISITRVDAQAPKRTKSPPMLSTNESIPDNSHVSRHDSMRPSLSPPGFRARWNDLDNLSESHGSEISPMFPPSAWGTHNDDGSIKSSNFRAPKRSPPLVSTTQVFHGNSSAQDKPKRPDVSPPRFVNRTDNSNGVYKSQPIRSNEDKSYIVNPTNISAPKRSRSPPSISTDRVFQGIPSPQDDSEREMQAKAKRLARFKVELSQPVESTTDFGNQNPNLNRHGQSLPGRQNTVKTLSADMEGDHDDTVLPDHEGPKSTTVITGLCPDMCPVSEREERERKGDLDQYERLDGDRNRTNNSLAVKKYNRTAEREANLIRPMPVLKKTVDYLLNLLDQPYDEKFLGLYNFLWDRMRAIRMDLRMQHLFNCDSITMLEQMIRLHIIAMHELCEYTKGEGFSEGFDAHLNIEQMNKTSVELFQLYDDHRKNGINVPTEKEFRGYYALLKLDKHPGYKVEPAELSHDLSKMTPEIRQTREVLFARDVARACRTGNFIAFFRLARKASYLQACLMHAHFAKLRTLALASLHSGLQINQGIPVALVAKWLAMEGEDIESLLEYHGFLIREFDEPYMVKDGQFLNSDNDFPLNCSELVHLKKAEMISEDVSSISTMSSYSVEPKVDPLINKQKEPKPVVHVKPTTSSPILTVDEVMNDNEAVPSPKSSTHVKPLIKTPSFSRQSEKPSQMAHLSPPSWDFSAAISSPKSPQASPKGFGKSLFSSAFKTSFGKKNQVTTKAIPMQVQEKLESPRHSLITDSPVSKMVSEDIVEDKQHEDIGYENLEPEEVDPTYDMEVAEEEVDPTYDDEVAEAKLRLIFRIWRRYSLRKREVREQRQLAAVAALSSLSLGPPIRQSIYQPSTPSMIDIDFIANERYERHEKSWSSLNVSEVIADTLSGRISSSECFCWKLILCSQIEDSDSFTLSWLRSKLMPMKKDSNFDVVTSSENMSIWKKWISYENLGGPICYLSIIKEAEFDNLSETVLGSCAMLFLISEGSSLEIERERLHSLVSSLPLNSMLPLLIFVDSYEESSNSLTTMVDRLGLNKIDKSLVREYSLIFLKKNEFEDFDEEVGKGLKWLAKYSPLPPIVRCVKTWDLIGAHLSSSMKVLDEIGAYEVGPEHCISAFNKALNQIVSKIVKAANANRFSWPCPEINLIDRTSDEGEMVNLHLPLPGWSSPDWIDQLVSALRKTELSDFGEDFSWLYRGSNSRNQIKNQKQLLENCLISYLGQMGLLLATNEAHVMVQKSARLELHGSKYYIIPMWVKIFRRIFNWRLMGLSTGPASIAYVLEHDMVISASGMEKFGAEDNKSSPCDLIYPSLDEMIDRCTEIEVFNPLPSLASGGSKSVKFIGSPLIGKLTFDEDDILNNGSNEKTAEVVLYSKPTKEAGKLNDLLEKCHILQDGIDKKLSFYF